MPCTNTPSQIPLCLSSLCSGLVRVDLLSILIVANTWGRSTIAAAFAGTDTDNLAVDGARDTVLKLEVHLGNGVLWEYRGVRDITNGSRFNHVADGESLYRFVLGRASGAVGTSDRLDVTTTLLVTSI